MSSDLFTGIKYNTDRSVRTYTNGLVTAVTYPVVCAGQKTPREINILEHATITSSTSTPLKKTDSYPLGTVGNTPLPPLKSSDDSDWSLTEIWEDYSMYIIGVAVLIAAVIAFLVYRNMGATQVVENIAAAFGLV
jgi:hypothetical protein